MKAFINTSIIFILLISCKLIIAENIPEPQAALIAKNFYVQKYSHELNFSGNEISIDLATTKDSGETTLLYIYNINQQGFIIISGWDGTIPVLAFSPFTKYEPEQSQPPAFTELIEGYENEVKYAIENDLEATPEIRREWTDLLSAENRGDSGRSVNPLLSTNWNQSCYYNELCPEDAGSPSGYCGRVPAGCVALAMAQVMKYWDYPHTGIGSHSYYASPYGTQSADFGNTTYEWDNMPNGVYSSNLAVATLIYHCAVSVNMQFGPNGSGASTSMSRNSLVNYFNYSPEAQYLNKSNYSNSVWEGMLRENLDFGRPIIYRGQGTGGHAWVCDGYSADNYFHMNWGWGGYANGYFYLSNLNPAGYTFTDNQAAIMGIVPAEAIVEPPVNLEAATVGNNINLTWSPPFEPQWIHWDNGTTVGSVGISGGGSFYAAARWAPEDLEDYNDLYITKVSVYISSTLPEYELKIWKGENAANLIYTQSMYDLDEENWNIIELTNPLQIDASDEMYIGFSIIDQPDGESTIGRDSGPAINGCGGLLSFDGSSWNELQTFGMNSNWNIQAYVNSSPDGKVIAAGNPLPKQTFSNPNTELFLMPVTSGSQTNFLGNRGLLGYNIYRDEVKINETIIAGTSYSDQEIPSGTYSYYVTSIYNAGESDPSNIVVVSSGTLTNTFYLTQGWNSISSNLIPVNPDMANICIPIMDDLIIIQGLYDVYYPELSINTIGDWEHAKGYLIKVAESCQLPFQGFTNSNPTIQLNNGWNLISVLSECDVETEVLFADIVNYVRVVKDAAGTGVYWPSKGINTLPFLQSGKAYYVKIFSNKTITFPVCE